MVCEVQYSETRCVCEVQYSETAKLERSEHHHGRSTAPHT